MNFKKIFLSLLCICSIATITATEHIKTLVLEETILTFLDTIQSPLALKNQEGIFICSGCKELHSPEQQQILLLILLVNENKDIYAKPLAVEALKYICAKKTELILETFDILMSAQEYEFIPVLINAGINLDEKVKNKNYTLKEKLEARFGSRKIRGVKSANCNGLWSKVSGQSEECEQIKKNLDLFEQKKTVAH